MRPIQINEYFKQDENVLMKSGLRGVVILGHGRHTVHKKDPFGRISSHSVFEEIESIGENIVPIGGYQFAFDKLFNIGLDEETTLRVGDLNDEYPMMRIGVQRGDYRSHKFNKETFSDASEIQLYPDETLLSPGKVNIPALNYIFGFMIGDGAHKQDGSKPIAPDYKNRTLYHAIPFRMSNDMGAEEINESIYCGRSQTQAVTGNPVTSYYVKKFDDPAPHIVHSWVSDDVNELKIVDDSVFSDTSSSAIESYVEINFSISSYDTRGYFTMNDGTPRVNEFALVSGWYNHYQNDYESIRLFTKFTRPSLTLDGQDHIEGIYRLYAR